MKADVLVFHIRAQNAGVIFRRKGDQIVFECFEAAAPSDHVMAALGKLVCSFPGPAITFPAQLFDGAHFRRELASFLTHMDRDYLEDNLTGSNQVPHPRYITQLLTDIMNGLSQARPAQIRRFTKRISDDVLSNSRNQPPWRRSPVWLVLRVALQLSLYEG